MTKKQSADRVATVDCSLSLGLTNAMLNNINNLILEWGEAGGLFLSIEPFMRFIAEVHAPFRDKIADLIKQAKKKPQFTNYWDCDPIFLTNAIKTIFGKEMKPDELKLISKFPSLRGKFLHGNFIELMEVLEIEPTSRRILPHMGPGKRKRLEPGEIYESFLSMKNNAVFDSLRKYSSTVTEKLKCIIRSLAK